MKVTIDLSPLYSGHQFRGIGFYTKRLVEAIQSLVAKEKQGVKLEFVKSIGQLRFIRTDLIHYPYFSPFFLTLPSKPLAPSVVTIHDLTPVKYSAHFPPGVRGKIRWQIQKRKLLQMRAVITDSQLWKREIAELTSFPLKKIFPIPLAAGEEFKVIDNEQLLMAIKRKYHLPTDFILYVGDVNWNKNIPGLIKAFRQYTSEVEGPPTFVGGDTSEVRLVLVGRAFEDQDLKETKELVQLIKSLGLNGKIIRLGWVSTEDLAVIYNLARVYCQPSFDEGFGLPVLEAMASGCPVVAARAGSLPEICQEAAIMVDPNEVESIAEGIKEAMEYQEKLIKKGFNQSRRFSWEKTARQTIGVYGKVLADGES